MRKMKLADLPRQRKENVTSDRNESAECDVEKVITGNLCPETIEEGDLDDDITVGTDLCVYTESSVGRPWVGRVQELLPNKKFIIHWYSRRSGRGKTFRAMKKADGSPYLSEQDFDTIMFWQMSEDRTEESFTLSNFWFETMRLEYEKLDR